MKKILVTGATGFLGTELVAQLAEQDCLIYTLVRAKDEEEALWRLKISFQEITMIKEKIGKKIIPVCGDFTLDHLGLADEKQQVLMDEIDIVIHSGADVGILKSKDELMKVNLAGTNNLLAFAKRIKKLERFVYISTAYVAGAKKGLIKEAVESQEKYCGYYEESKSLAEQAVSCSGLNYTICRPGMIVGHSKTGRIKSFNTIYYVLKLILLKKINTIPVSKNQKLNIIPVDDVARGVIDATFSKSGINKVYHLTCPKKLAPTVYELAEYVKRWAAVNLQVKVSNIHFVPMPFLKNVGINYNKKTEAKKHSLVSNLITLMPYFFDEHDFDQSNVKELETFKVHKWNEYIDALLDYACSKNFMHQTGRTVFEQAWVRRESTSNPITYFDIKKDGIYSISGQDMNKKVAKIAGALQTYGVKRGSKVALTGVNSTDYIALDMAIGLVGAVSVPIYYTAPIEEVNLLLDKSGAEWFFIGDRRMMSNITKERENVLMIAFSDGIEIAKDKSFILQWDAFLDKQDGSFEKVYVEPDDLATIRYTSGTTGEPKGVMFSYGQLQFMGEVLTNLLSYEERNKFMRYLSFLPLSHVVEGILAAYAPYYMLCKEELFYLNDFGSLNGVLPKVRPTVFFSVPRFYEKVFQQVSSNKIGQIWLNKKSGLVKKALGVLLKKVTLKKAGLDLCSQLIVGSAPMSEALLYTYRELGIEVHNAYGQTEAPLITINRKGDNIIPTIGTTLPKTSIDVAEDGELIVRGPQVALGYYGLETDTIKDGVLKTGDLGFADAHKHFSLIGRKKEMIITAYGKNINCPKIEERLKDIDEISEAVLIGENRPYCTALLWIEDGREYDADRIKNAVAEMNAHLSHPEQIREYRVIDKPLSIKEGELTPNLKVRRNKVEDHYQTVIEEMYRK